MARQRKRYSVELKTKVALEAMKGHKTANEIATEYGVHPTQIAQWEKQALDGLPSVFATRASEQQKSEEELINTLYQQIGHVIRAGGLVGKKITNTALKANERSLSRGILS
jgi:transposase-like protein